MYRALIAFVLLTASLAIAGCSSNADSQAALSAPSTEVQASRTSRPSPPREASAQRRNAPGAPLDATVQAAPVIDVPEGTVIEAKLDKALDSSLNHAGDTFTATVFRDVVVDGRRAIPAGSTLHGIVRAATSARRGAGKASLSLAFNSLELPDENSVAMVASFTDQTGSMKKRDAAIIGASAAGGAAGTGVVMAKEGEQVRLPAGSSLSLRLDQSVQVPRRS